MGNRTACSRRHCAIGWAALLVCGPLIVTGCGTPDAAADTQSPGTGQQVGVVGLREIVLVTTDKGGPGRILGSLVNDSTAPVEVMISDNDDELTVVVPAHGNHSFAAHEIIFDTVDARPGQTTAITVTTPAVSTRLAVSVVDGARDPYTSYLPD